MPLNFAELCPLLLGSDVISLPSHIAVDRRKLQIIDKALLAHHTFAKECLAPLLLIEAGVSYAFLIKQTNPLATQMLLGFLNHIGGLHVRRSAHKQLASATRRCLMLMHGSILPSVTFSSEATYGGVLLAATRASVAVVIVAIIVEIIAIAGGLISLETAHHMVVVLFCSLVLSVSLHEMSHVWFLRRQKSRCRVMQRGLRLGIAHTALPSRASIQTALLGPLVTGVVCCTISVLLLIHSHHLYSAFIAVLGLLHLASLLPWYGDGQSILRALRKDKNAPKNYH